MNLIIGTVAAFIFGVAFMLFASGIDKKYVITVIAIIIIVLPLSYLYILPEHAKSRIDVFLNPELDPRGAGYNLIQSKLAIGSGKLIGMGILKGNQTQLRIPLSKNDRLYFFSYRGRNGVCNSRINNSAVCCNNYQNNLYCKNC